ncbi:MAG TPA: recombinase RecF [Serratia grimesii]|uniref:Recombinase RecF n=1 Tax=Serratia grimesii TaxID=82995 RepID=A0A9C7V5A4_9GAMM|nr:recombinase RecF [Serratia grimesii]
MGVIVAASLWADSAQNPERTRSMRGVRALPNHQMASKIAY